MKNYIIVNNKTRSRKVGNVAVTYAPVQSCPKTCKFLNNGCYAQNGHCGFSFRRISKAGEERKRLRPSEIAEQESKSILSLPGDKPLRLHISGDCRTSEAAEILSVAADKYISKHGQKVWTYTHSWDTIPRHKWGNISVLASCETFEDAEKAMKSGYAVCMTRYKKFDKVFNWNGFKMIPCLEQIKGTTCDKCKICTRDSSLFKTRSIICFFSHGSQKNKVNNVLKNLKE